MPDPYPHVPAWLVGSTRFLLELGLPVLSLVLALVASAVAVVTGDLTPGAIVGAGALSGGASLAAKSGYERRERLRDEAATTVPWESGPEAG
jgi:hypothetical protein